MLPKNDRTNAKHRSEDAVRDLEIAGPHQEIITSFEEWASIFKTSKKQRHWKQYRSAYSLAEFVMSLDGLNLIRDRVSTAIGASVDFERAIIEHEVRFDRLGHGREHDLGIFGRTEDGQSLYVGVEAKVDEPFGPPIQEIYVDAKSGELSGISTNAPQRIEELLKFNFKLVDRTKFALRYQLLYSTAGTLAAGADLSVLFFLVFKTPLYDELIGASNFRDYLAFANAVESRVLATSTEQSDQREFTLGDSKLLCIYEHYRWPQ